MSPAAPTGCIREETFVQFRRSQHPKTPPPPSIEGRAGEPSPASEFFAFVFFFSWSSKATGQHQSWKCRRGGHRCGARQYTVSIYYNIFSFLSIFFYLDLRFDKRKVSLRLSFILIIYDVSNDQGHSTHLFDYDAFIITISNTIYEAWYRL